MYKGPNNYSKISFKVKSVRENCDTTKTLAGKYSRPKRLVDNKEEEPVNVCQDYQNIEAGLFGELLNRPMPPNSPEIETAHTDPPSGILSPTK